MDDSPAIAREQPRTLRSITIPDLLFAAAKRRAAQTHRKISEYICHSVEQQIARETAEQARAQETID